MPSAPDTINPLIDRILSNPLTFVPARKADRENDTAKPASYIVLNKSSKTPSREETSSTPSLSSASPQEPMRRPKSMAEAVAAYTGKKFLTKAEKKKLKRDQKSAKPAPSFKLVDSDEDVGEDLAQSSKSASASESDSQYESASEYPSDQASKSDHAPKSSDNASSDHASKHPSEEDTVDAGDLSSSQNHSTESLPFADFGSESNVSLSSSSTDTNEKAAEIEHDAESDNNDESESDNDESESDADFALDDQHKDNDSAHDEDSASESEDESSDSSADEDDNLEKLKEDLINDAFKAIDNETDRNSEHQQQTGTEVTQSSPSNVSSTNVPPSKSSVSEEAHKPSAQAIAKHASPVFEKAPSPSLDAFQKINENPQDRGSNNSVRILKNWTKPFINKKPVGLLNHGVTCYMNSAIQAVLHVPAVQHYLNEVHSGKHNKTLKPRSVTHVLAELSQRMWGLGDGDGNDNGKQHNPRKQTKMPKFINPKKIIQRLDDINCMMSEWQQEDSHEYFMSLVSRLQEDSTPKGVKLNQSVFYDIFGGLLNQSVTCQNCGHISETKQEFYDLSLGLNKRKKQPQASAQGQDQQEDNKEKAEENEPQAEQQAAQSQQQESQQQTEAQISLNNRYSIEKSIKEFFGTELIKADRKDKGSGYYCEKCKSHSSALKHSTIDRSPETLTIHLKRFKFNGSSSSKVKQSVSYPKYLDLTDYTTSQHDPAFYQLISVIVHEGRSISSGHYIAHCLQPDGNWATYDDEYINRINEREALSDASAYFLLYTKLTPKSFKRKQAEGGDSHNKKKKRSS